MTDEKKPEKPTLASRIAREEALDERAETRTALNQAFGETMRTIEHDIEAKMDESVRDVIFEDIEPPEGTQRMTPKMEQVAIAMAKGVKTYAELGRKAGLAAATVSKWAKRPDFRKWVRALQIHLGILTVDEEFKKLLPRAIEVTREIMVNHEERGSTRLDAATRIIERVMGKATQPVEHRGNLLKQVIAQIDAESEADFADELKTLEKDLPKDEEEIVH